MPDAIYILAGAAIGALAAYVTARITTRTQLDIARLNADKDITLQRERLLDERFRNELAVERGKLDSLHRILSRIALENSQTMSYFQTVSSLGVEKFRTRYLENCERLHEAMAIADIYYPKMSDNLRKVYGQTNVFWGNQESLIRTDVKTNKTVWEQWFLKILDASEAIESHTQRLKDQVAVRAKELTESISC